MRTRAQRFVVAVAAALGVAASTPVAAQSGPQPQHAAPPASTATPAAPKPGVTPPSDYVIGPDDQLSIYFWRDKELSADVVVRPDGKISLPLLNDVQAAGFTPEQLRVRVTEDAKRYIEDPTATVVVRQINSRKVFITGEVEKPGPYPLTAPTTVLQLISMAGGLKEYANGKKIVVMRTENGRQIGYPFNYKDVINRKNMKQNIELKPGDTIVVPAETMVMTQ
jgi:polysaccharide export outer membrane protein